MPLCPQCQASNDEGVSYCSHCGKDLVPAPAGAHGDLRADPRTDPWIGQIVDGRYRVHAKIGQGGMGAVYRVEHLRISKVAAMKVLHAELALDRDLVKRFRREAEAVSRLTHPNSVQTFDFGQVGDAMYLVMEYLRGESLAALLRRDGPAPFLRTAGIVIQVCCALAEAHELGIIHRDLKPENIFVSHTKDGADHVKVLDYGLAKIRESEALNEITARGCLIGTPYYMSPEQVRSEDLDGRSDIYSLGAVMYRMLTGHEPFTGASPVAVLTKHLTDEPVPPRQRRPDLDIDPGAEAIVLRAMAKRREDRYQTADALREELERRRFEVAGIPAAAASALSGAVLVTPPPRPPADSAAVRVAPAPAPKAVARLSREDWDHYETRLRRRKYVALIVPACLLVLGGAGWWGFHRMSTSVPDEESEPNNEPAGANPLASGKPVRGFVGKRLTRERSDRDFFRVPAASDPHATRILAARVTGIPNMDLTLELYDLEGQRVAQADGAGPSLGEALPNVSIDGREHFLCVREVWVSGKPPTENVTDQYVLTATWSPASATDEIEPNDSVEQATPLPLGGARRGYLSGPEDVDHYRLVGAPGAPVTVEVSGVPGVPLRVRAWTPAAVERGEDARLGAATPVQQADSPAPGAPVRVTAPWPADTPAPAVAVEVPPSARQRRFDARVPYTIAARR
ncbi:MAG TPA: protein kinase [Polyangia bacterium]|jgi:serine/threonine-protein kinase